MPDDSPVTIAADIVSAYVANNSVPAAELPSLINSVYGELRDLAQTDHTPFTAEQLEQLKRYLLHQVTTIDPSELSPIDEDTEEE